MNYILIFSYKEFLKCKDLFQNEKKCFIVPKELDEKILVENKIVFLKDEIDANIVDKILASSVSKIFIFSFLEKSKQPLENNPEEVSSFIKNKFINLVKLSQTLIKIAREKKALIAFFVQEIATFSNSFDFFNNMFINMMESFVLGLWNELRIFGIKPQLFVISQNFKDVKKINKEIKANNKPIIKLNIKSNFLKKNKKGSVKHLSKVSYA